MAVCSSVFEDVIVRSRSSYSHTTLLKDVALDLQGAKVTLKLKKCYFFTASFAHFGHSIRLRRLEKTTHSTEAFRELKTITNVAKFCSF